jgi:hypothetical protein
MYQDLERTLHLHITIKHCQNGVGVAVKNLNNYKRLTYKPLDQLYTVQTVN